MNTQSDANTRKNKRITITFLLICISWAILTLPHRVFSIFQEVILTAILPNDKTAGGMGFVKRRLYHSLAEGATVVIYTSYSSANCIFLLVLLEKFREPFKRCYKFIGATILAVQPGRMCQDL